MKKRHFYCLLFGIPGLLVSLLICFILFGITAGFLWLYVYGDNSWPSSTEKILSISFVLIFLILWVTSMTVGFIIGKNHEEDSVLNKKHILISAGITIAPIILIVLYQWHIGNIGRKSDNTLCKEFCNEKGYSASGMPAQNSGEKSCSCFDNHGNEAIKIPLEKLVPSTQK